MIALHVPRPLQVVTLVGLVLLLLLLLLEIFLVPVVNWALDRRYVEHKVQVVDVDLHPLRGAYALDGLTVRLRDKPEADPALSVDHIDASIDARALLRRTVVGSVHFEHPVARFTDRKKNVEGPDITVARMIRDLLPLRINRLAVDDGAVYYRTRATLPAGNSKQLDLKVTHLLVRAENLTNSAELSDSLFGNVFVMGVVEGWGDLRGRARLNPLADLPTFDLDVAATNIPLPQLNDWALAYGKFKFEAGSLDIFSEVAARDGRFRGYVKPLARGVETKAGKQEIRSKVVAKIVEGAAKLLENRETRRAGSRVPIEGTLAPRDTDVEPDLWSAVWSVLRNALVEALLPVVDGTVSLQDAPKQ